MVGGLYFVYRLFNGPPVSRPIALFNAEYHGSPDRLVKENQLKSTQRRVVLCIGIVYLAVNNPRKY
jgi:hypothetical protein